MKYKALYRETRPEVFDEILGQDSIVKILKHQIMTDTVSHAYIFTGTRGTGKTTTARILAKAVNCEAPDVAGRPCGKCAACRQIAEGTFVDVVEIDAASNNGVDNIRELRESVNYPPAVGRVKVYIIDEVHMLSTGAFNALLKTLEEPPENVIFILATTNPEKLPQTVLSRCMRLDFKRVPQTILAQHMRDICSDRGVEIADDALKLLASNADGSVRDSLSILEQCLSSGEKVLTRDLVLDFLGAVSEEFYLELTRYVMSGDVSNAFVLIDKALSDGKDVKQIMKDWMGHLRNVMIAKFVDDPSDLMNLSSENIELIQSQASGIGLEDINRAIITLAKTINDARYSTQARVLLEVAVVSIASGMEYGEAPAGGSREIKTSPVPNATIPSAKPAPGIKAEPPVRKAEPVSGIQAEPQIKRAEPESSTLPQTSAEDDPFTSGSSSTGNQGSDAGQERLEDIWRDVCQEARQQKPVLQVLENCVISGQKGDEIKIITNLAMAKNIIEKNAQMINDLLRRFGSDGHIVCALGGEQQSMGLDDAENDVNSEMLETQRAASALLGIDVKIEQ